MTDIKFNDPASLEIRDVLVSLELTLRLAQKDRHPQINRLIRKRCNALMETVKLETTRSVLRGVLSKQLCSVELEKALAIWTALKSGELEVDLIPESK